MNSRERVLAALNHQTTDRVPRLLYGEAIGYVPAIETMLRKRCAPLSACDYFDMDITSVSIQPTTLSRERFASGWGEDFKQAACSGQLDEWGVWWRSGSFHHFAHIESPLRNLTDARAWSQWPWPDLDQPYRYEGLAERTTAMQQAGRAVCGFAGSIFEQAWYLRGMENLMADMLCEPDAAHDLLERTALFQRYAAEQMAAAGVDIIITGDDVAGQHGLLMSAATWRTFLKPRLARTIAAVKATNPQARVFYHSDGNITDLIPELIEIGVDILNPLQPECLDPAQIKKTYGDRLSFWGAVSVQQTMPLGTPEQVRQEVCQRIETLGQGGGYILAPAHVLGPETPWENIVAFFEAADQTLEPVSTRSQS